MTETAEEGTVTEHAVHFDLDGAWFADLVRSRVKEGVWEHALSMLVDNLHGMTHEQAVAILRGRADLSGWASDKDGLGFDHLPEDHELAREMDEVYRRLYGSTFRWKDDYWKPYATVTGYGEDDMMFARKHERPVKSSGFPQRESWRYAAGRALYYANSAEDLVVYVPYPSRDFGTVVLCERSKMPPTWLKASTESPEAHLAKVLASGLHLPERGFLPDLDYSPAVKTQPARPRRAAAVSPGQAVQTPSEMAKEFLERLNKTETAADIDQLEGEFDRRFVEAREHDVSDEVLAAEKAAHDRRLAAYRQAIAEQADRQGGWLELNLADVADEPVTGGAPVVRVPRNPFILWCLHGNDYGKATPGWEQVCPSGLKMLNDDPYHTDWMVGAGLDLEGAYDHSKGSYAARLQTAAYVERSRIVEEWSQSDFVTLSRGREDRIFGTVVKPGPNEEVEPGSVAVVPHAGPEYQLALETACKKGKYGRPGAVICATGGKLAHLAIVGREMQHTLIMVPNAVELLPEGAGVTIDLAQGKLSWN